MRINSFGSDKALRAVALNAFVDPVHEARLVHLGFDASKSQPRAASRA
jgi:hypothetical protein